MNLNDIGQKNKPELSVVVLGYQAGLDLKTFISELVDHLESAHINYQIVLVGNYWPGSNDITPKVVNELAQLNPRIKPVIKPKKDKKEGMSWDMRSGLDSSDGELIAVIDGDGQMPSYDIIKVYQKIKKDNLDFVTTFREKRFDNFWRRMISSVYNLIFKILFPGLKLKDINSKPKIFTRKLFNKLELVSDGWFIDAEMMIQIRRYRNKFKIGEIPTIFNQNKSRSSFIKIPAVLEFVKSLIKARIHESFNHWRHR